MARIRRPELQAFQARHPHHKPLPDLLAALAAAPDLKGAMCVGKWKLFDPACRGEGTEKAAERHAVALELCARCPALARCREYVDSLKPSQRPRGVVAGRVIEEPIRRAAS